MRIRRFPRLVVLALGLSFAGRADGGGVGTTGANLLKVNAGSRALAMGGAATALTGDLSGILANPSLLSAKGRKSLMLMHWPGLADMRTEFLSYAVPFRGIGMLAGTVLFRTLPDIDNRPGMIPPVPVNDGLLVLTAARQVESLGGDAGVNLKLFNSALGAVRASSMALDGGVLMRSNGAIPVEYGFSVVNLGPPIKHERTGEPLPLALRGGVSTGRVMHPHSYSLAADLTVNIEQEVTVAAGAEWIQRGLLGLRAGGSWSRYRGARATFGAGWRLRSSILGRHAVYDFDYAYLPFAFESGSRATHALSLSITF